MSEDTGTPALTQLARAGKALDAISENIDGVVVLEQDIKTEVEYQSDSTVVSLEIKVYDEVFDDPTEAVDDEPSEPILGGQRVSKGKRR